MPNGATYPGAVETVGDWAKHISCSGSLVATGHRFDLDRMNPGEETVEQAYSGCPAGTDVQLWTIEGGAHVPPFNENWAGAIWAFMATHPKVSRTS
jgi:polyhydroxybutyrate depolymerase